MSNILIKLKEIAESNPNNIRILYNNCKEKDPFYSVFSGIPGHTDLLEHVQNYKHKFEEPACRLCS